jgi:MFS family permease
VAPTLSVLTRNRDFRYLFLAELVVFGGDWFALIPLITLLQEMTGSGLPGALALTADTAVNAVLLPYAGTLADRFDRKKIMIVANLAALGAIGLLFAVQSPGLAWIGPVAIGLAAAAKAFYTPAAGAALPNVVDPADLPAANALGGSAWGTMLVVGASLGGIVSEVFNPYVCFGITVICLAAAAALTWRVRRPMQIERDGTAPTRTLHAIGESLRYIRRNPRVLSLVTVKSAVGLGNGVLAVFPILATAVFAIGSIGTGLLFAARGFGALVGPLLLRRVLTRRSWLMPGLAISMVAYGLAYLGVAFSPWFWLALCLVVVAHIAGGGNWVMSNYALQIVVPDGLRGRVFATDMMIATLAISVSLLFAGAIVDHVDPRVPVAVCATLTLVYGIVWRLVTRRLLREDVSTAPGGEAAGDGEQWTPDRVDASS